MLSPGAIYRFNRTKRLRYYRAARTKADVDFLYPISLDGARIADEHPSGRRYVLLYFMTRWGKLAASGYWLDPKQAFEKAYVTDATLDDPGHGRPRSGRSSPGRRPTRQHLNRHEIELDMDVWGGLLEE